eukprot:8130629-Alexandrium_andersonii.AAC.1
MGVEHDLAVRGGPELLASRVRPGSEAPRRDEGGKGARDGRGKGGRAPVGPGEAAAGALPSARRAYDAPDRIGTG